jgi:ATP-binding cassette, subfamily B, bacterial PglK
VLDTFLKTFYLVGRDRPGRWASVIGAAVIASGFEMFGAVLVFAVLGIVADPSGQAALPIVGNVRRWFAGVDDTTFLIGIALVLGAFFLLRVIVQVGFQYIKQRTAHNAGVRLSSRLAEGYLRMPYAFHLRRNSSELVRNAHQTVEELARQCFVPVVQILGEAIVVSGLLIVMIAVAPVATAGSVVVVGAALLLLQVVQPRLKRLGSRAQAERKTTLEVLQQSLHGIRDIKVLGSEAHFGRKYRRSRGDLARALYLHGTIAEMPRHVIETALISFILILLGTTVITGTQTDQVLSTLGLFAYAGLRMMPSLQKIVGGLNNVRFSGPAIDHVYADLRLIEDFEHEVRGANLTFDAEIRLKGVGFVYEGGNGPAISDVNLVVEPGEVIGICGPTGGGKTTLMDVLTGLLAPTTGSITIDGQDLQTGLHSWFSKLGVVPQMVFLVDDTVKANIALGVPADSVDADAMLEALELAQLDIFVRSLPHGLETMVGERGVRVSGGQRQRIAIARALYRRPEVLLFDEGTSALDNATEAALISSLERLRGSRTIFLVAHRLSTVRNCDRIIFMEDGRLSAVGSYEDLLTESAGFRTMAGDL